MNFDCSEETRAKTERFVKGMTLRYDHQHRYLNQRGTCVPNACCFEPRHSQKQSILPCGENCPDDRSLCSHRLRFQVSLLSRSPTAGCLTLKKKKCCQTFPGKDGNFPKNFNRKGNRHRGLSRCCSTPVQFRPRFSGITVGSGEMTILRDYRILR